MSAWQLGVSLAIVLVARGAAAETGIFVIKASGGEERKVVSVPGMAFHGSPRWSHDGKRIAFDAVAEDEGIRKFYVVNLDGSGLKELGEQSMPDWSPDDKQLVYHHNGDDRTRRGIWVANANGEDREWLVLGACPRWAPDGSRIAFTDWRGLKAFDVVSGEEQTLFDEPLAEFPHGFDWSKDGMWLAFVARRRADAKARELFIISADPQRPANRVRLAREDNMGKHANWSPDGKQLAITLDAVIHLLNVEGDQAPRLVAGQSDKSRDPVWSPDGEWLVFARRPR